MYENINIGLSTKTDGPMKNSSANRDRYLERLGFGSKKIVSAGLIHSNRVALADDETTGMIAGVDALITDKKDHLLTITVADCLPIYFHDPRKKAVAIAHAGWRGAESGIAKEVIAAFRAHYHSDPQDIEAFIGPHIRDCHFEVQEDVASRFDPVYLKQRADKTYIDLAAVVKDQLMQTGLDDSSITVSTDCTFCDDDRYYSFRRDKPEDLEAMIAYIGL